MTKDDDANFFGCFVRNDGQCLYHYLTRLTQEESHINWAIVGYYLETNGKRLKFWCGKQGK